LGNGTNEQEKGEDKKATTFHNCKGKTV
jgi:hypothetical protein